MDDKDARNQHEVFLASAVQQEVFNRIFPHLRHDLVGYISAALMRVSIMERHLNREQYSSEKLHGELSKIESHLRETIVRIREQQCWDFQSGYEDSSINVLRKAIALFSGHLALRGITINFEEKELAVHKVAAQPLLYCLLSLFSYIEDTDNDNSVIEVGVEDRCMHFSILKLIKNDTIAIKKNRNIKISQQIISDFVRSQSLVINFHENLIELVWN